MRQKLPSQRCFTDPWLTAQPARELAAMSALLEQDSILPELVEQDLELARRRRGPSWSAGGLRGEQVLRALILKQMHGFSFRALAFHLADSRTYRTFCCLGWLDPAPSKSALAAGIKALRPETLEAIHQRLLATTVARQIETGCKVRVDATVVESAIHVPADSELLWDGVRVLTRLMQQARELLGSQCPAFSNHQCRAKRRRKEVLNARNRKQRKRPYRDLLGVTRTVVGYATQVRQALQEHSARDVRAMALAQEMGRYLPRVQQVIEQTRRRVLEGESVPAADKIVSLFEEHTDIVRKDRRETLYGHKICLTSGASSLILDCQVLKGNPADSTLAVPMIQRQVELYERPPRQAAFDGGFASKDNLAKLKSLGVQDVAFSKRRGMKITDMVRSSWVYQRLRDFRAGIEGIISWLKRVFGLDRCTWRSFRSFQAYVWGSILSFNLLVLARHLIE